MKLINQQLKVINYNHNCNNYLYFVSGYVVDKYRNEKDVSI